MTRNTAQNTALFSADDLRRRVRARGLPPDRPAAAIVGASSDDLRLAAVLVPVIDRASAASVLLTKRADHLPAHAGQIAFPGGKIEPRDRSVVEAALREAREEVGLAPSAVEPLGVLDCYCTATGFRIAPVVALVAPEARLELDRTEVAEAFEVPLAFLMTSANHRRHSIAWQGQRRHFYAMPYGNRYIWGATAGILRMLYERLYRECYG